MRSSKPVTDSTSTTGKETRRDFLRKSAVVATAASTPYTWTSSYARAEDKNSKLTVAAIGVGGSRGRYNRGRQVANQAAKLGEMIAVCDVDQLHNEEYNEAFDGKLAMYQDYRKLFDEQKPDIVTIGTPDHWHVPIALHALEAGCHVYCEKPLTLTLEEGPIIREAAKASGKTFQVGTQQRTEVNRLFMYANAIVRSGRLGENVNAHVGIDSAPTGGPFETTDVPDGLDWDLWLGPAPKQDYSKERRRFFRWYLEYSGGKMTDWGAHHIDIAQWAMQLDHTGPSSVTGKGQLTPLVPDDFNWDQFLNGDVSLPNGYNAATKFNINLNFENDRLITVNNEYESGSTKFGNGILFEGEKGRIFVNRGKLQGAIVKELFGADLISTKVGRKKTNNFGEAIGNLDPKVRDEFDATFTEICHGEAPKSHMQNFFDCIGTDRMPVSDVASHVNTMASCHLCNVAIMLGRDLKWEPTTENFGSDEQANALISRKRRDGFELTG